MKFLAAVGVLVLGFVSATSSVAAGRHPTTGAWPDTDFVDESTLKVSIGSSSAVLPSSSQCVSVPGTSVGDVAVVNITNTNATGRGWGALRASGTTPVFNRPLADQYSSVNFAANTPPNPNLAVSPVGADGKVCYDGAAASHNVILDLSAVIPAGNVNAIDPERILDTRPNGAVLTSCEGTDTSVIPGRLAQPVVCSFPWGLAESTDFIGSGPTVIVTLLNTIERRAIRSWWQVEDGPAASGYTVDAIVGQGIPRAAAQLLFDALDACSGCAYRNP